MSKKLDRGRAIRDADDARTVLAAIPASGLTLAEYCAHHDINRWSLYYWRSKLTHQRLNKTPRHEKTPDAPPRPLPTFAEVHLPTPTARYAIRAPSGWTLELDDAFDPHHIADLLALVARC